MSDFSKGDRVIWNGAPATVKDPNAPDPFGDGFKIRIHLDHDKKQGHPATTHVHPSDLEPEDDQAEEDWDDSLSPLEKDFRMGVDEYAPKRTK